MNFRVSNERIPYLLLCLLQDHKNLIGRPCRYAYRHSVTVDIGNKLDYNTVVKVIKVDV